MVPSRDVRTRALGKIKTVATTGTVGQWEPEQSMAAGGHGSVADYAPLAALEGK